MTQACRPVRAKALLFHKDEIHGSDEADECGKVIPMQPLPLEEDVGDDGEDDVSDTHSCITLSCTRLNGPPLAMNPMRLAGTWQQYSKKAIAQLKAMTPMSGQLLLVPVCWSLRCPYHASVMKMLLSTRSRIVYIPFIFSYVFDFLIDKISLIYSYVL